MAVKIRIKRGTTAQWNASTTALTPGELGYDLETKVIKIGDGTTLWNNLLPLNKFEIDEISQDAIYSALTDFVSVGNNITVEYNDPGNYIILDVGPNVVLQDDLTNAISALSSVYDAAGSAASAQLVAQLYAEGLAVNYDPVGSADNALQDAKDYTDIAISGLGNQIGEDYVSIGLVGTADGIAQLDENGFVPDSQISSTIARSSQLFSGSYNDLTNKPAIALGAVKWTANHYQLEGGANTRYLAGDIVWDGGNIYVANYDNESLPTTNTQYWSLVGAGNRLNIDGRDIPNILWDNILNRPTLFSGSYDDLTNKPTIFSGSYEDLTGLPTLFDGNYSSLIGSPTIPSDINDLTDTSNLLIPSASPSFTGITSVEDIEISGSLTFTGTATQIDSTVTVISDPMIYLGEGNANNINDLGFVASFNDGTYQHTGLVRDSSAGKWKLFKGVIDEPTSTVNFTQGSFDDLEVADITASSATINNPVITGKVTVNGTNTSYLSSAYSGYTGEISLDNTAIYISSADDAGGDAASVSIEAGILTLSGTTGTSPTTEMYLDNLGVQILRVNGSNSLTRLEVFGAQGSPSPLKITGDTSTFKGTVSFDASTVTGLGIDNKSDKLTIINSQSSSYTLNVSDLDNMIEMSGGGTLTISDSSSFPVGFSCNILQTGSSQVTIAGNGFTPNGTPGLKLRAQWSSATLVKRALNSWVAMGDLSA